MALASAQSAAIDGNFARADSTLAWFATEYPGTHEALETAYWRALFRMDPSNPQTSLPAAIASLDAYIGDSRRREHLTEALSLRRVARQLDGLSRIAANAMSAAKEATTTAANAKAQVADANARVDAAKQETPPAAEHEIRRLKDELAKANAELDRIRKRLSQPPPKP